MAHGSGGPTSGRHPIEISSPLPPQYDPQPHCGRERRRQAAAFSADAAPPIAPLAPAAAVVEPSGISLGPIVFGVLTIAWFAIRIAGWVAWKLVALAAWNFTHIGTPRGWDSKGRPVW